MSIQLQQILNRERTAELLEEPTFAELSKNDRCETEFLCQARHFGIGLCIIS